MALRGIAHAAADISDGLLGDLGHILNASGVGADIETEQVVGTLACLTSTQEMAQPIEQLDFARQLALTLSGGDDYELVFTASPHQRDAVLAASQASQTSVTRIGKITATSGILLRDAQGAVIPNHFPSFDHFKTT